MTDKQLEEMAESASLELLAHAGLKQMGFGSKRSVADIFLNWFKQIQTETARDCVKAVEEFRFPVDRGVGFFMYPVDQQRIAYEIKTRYGLEG